ncbi:MAG TPA: hypothetical protein VHW71_00195 [Steroidobacteraceae bacterium]|jgi:hypothetical protein|nr:hypothetical protein [Steroidobacteraceae bacterium]
MNRLTLPALLVTLGFFGADCTRAADLARFVGSWGCKGTFSNGAPIAARLSIEIDAPSGALIVHHDDVAPGAYHSLEVWMPDKSGAGVRAALSDRYSGMRWLQSSGWTGNTLTFVRLEDAIPKEQFAYEFKGDSLEVQWSLAKDRTMHVGDTITCKRV